MQNKSKRFLAQFQRFFICLVFSVIILSISVHLVYLYSQKPLAIPEAKYLHKAFQKEPYRKLLDQLNKNKYSAIKTQCKQCANQLINYLAHKSNKAIVSRDYTSLQGFNGVIMPIFWRISHFISQHISTPKIWVFWVSKTIPRSQIDLIKQLEPQSSIIIVTTNLKAKLKQKQFKDAGQIDNFDLVKILKQAKISQKKANAYAHYYQNNVNTIFRVINKDSSKIETILGKDYIKIKNLSTKAKQILTQLCEKGQLKKSKKITDQIKSQLQIAGVVYQNKRYEWQSEKKIMNYMLQTFQNCVWDKSSFPQAEVEELSVPKEQVKISTVPIVQNKQVQQPVVTKVEKTDGICVCNCNCGSQKKNKKSKKSKKQQKRSQNIQESQQHESTQDNEQNDELTQQVQTEVAKQVKENKVQVKKQNEQKKVDQKMHDQQQDQDDNKSFSKTIQQQQQDQQDDNDNKVGQKKDQDQQQQLQQEKQVEKQIKKQVEKQIKKQVEKQVKKQVEKQQQQQNINNDQDDKNAVNQQNDDQDNTQQKNQADVKQNQQNEQKAGQNHQQTTQKTKQKEEEQLNKQQAEDQNQNKDIDQTKNEENIKEQEVIKYEQL